MYGKNFCRSRASNSAENNPTWPKFELVPDFMPILDICKFEQVVIKTQGFMIRTTFPHYKSINHSYCNYGAGKLIHVPTKNNSLISLRAFHGWMTCDFTYFSTVFQSYQDDVWLIMKGCVQWKSVYVV